MCNIMLQKRGQKHHSLNKLNFFYLKQNSRHKSFNLNINLNKPQKGYKSILYTKSTWLLHLHNIPSPGFHLLAPSCPTSQ